MLVKDPQAVKDYGFDWSAWLVNSDSIASSVFSGSSGCAVTSSSISVNSFGVTICFVSSGTLDTTAIITNKITTTQGRIDERSFQLKIISL